MLILPGFADFSLKDKHLRANTERKLKEKNLDMIIANTSAAIGAVKTSVQIKTLYTKWLKIDKTAKKSMAKRVISMIRMRYKYGRQ